MIVDLIEQGRIVACAPVLSELRDDPIYGLRLKPYDRPLQAGDRDADDIEYLLRVGAITRDFSGNEQSNWTEDSGRSVYRRIGSTRGLCDRDRRDLQ
jgi:hypothetical protein